MRRSIVVFTSRLSLSKLLHRQLQKKLDRWIDSADRGQSSLQITDYVRAGFQPTSDLSFIIYFVHRAAIAPVDTSLDNHSSSKCLPPATIQTCNVRSGVSQLVHAAGSVVWRKSLTNLWSQQPQIARPRDVVHDAAEILSDPNYWRRQADGMRAIVDERALRDLVPTEGA
jgi:hypothetical protein